VDEDALRAQLTADFDAQLRELKRQKSQVEEELETSSGKWRTERRRLNSEIDRLESALASAKRSSGGNSGEMQKAFDEKFSRAEAEWKSERDRLLASVNRLEESLADTIARSSNPNRAVQTIKDQYEFKVAEMTRAQLEAERDFHRAKAAWNEEKGRLTTELISMRRGAPGTLGAGGMGSLEAQRIRDLEGQLNEARSATQKYHASAVKSAHDFAGARKEIESLNTALSEIRGELASGHIDRTKYDARIQDLIQQNAVLLQEKAEGIPDSQGEAAEATLSVVTLPGRNGSIDVEIARVEAEIDRIEKLFDDPDAVTSIIARKNREKAELEAYLRGIRFSIESKG
jgi:chromosome segregation ATPase